MKILRRFALTALIGICGIPAFAEHGKPITPVNHAVHPIAVQYPDRAFSRAHDLGTVAVDLAPISTLVAPIAGDFYRSSLAHSGPQALVARFAVVPASERALSRLWRGNQPAKLEANLTLCEWFGWTCVVPIPDGCDKQTGDCTAWKAAIIANGG